MFKRTIWFTTGAAVGLGSSYWVQRRVKQAAARFTPPALGRSALGGARQLGEDVRSAVSEGRAAARQREAELQAELDGGRRPTPASAISAVGTPGRPPRSKHHRGASDRRAHT